MQGPVPEITCPSLKLYKNSFGSGKEKGDPDSFYSLGERVIVS